MSRSNTRLHPLVCDWVARVVRAFDLVGGAHVAVVGLDALARVEEVPKDLVEDLDVRLFPSGVRTLDPHQVPAQNANPNLVSACGLPRVLVGRECVPPDRGPRLRDPKIGPVVGH